MDAATLARLRPTDQSADAVRDALEKLRAERTAAAHRTTALAAERTRLLLTATTSAIAKVEAAIREAMVDQEQLDAMSTALAPLLAAAEEREAAAAHAEQIQDAATATLVFNDGVVKRHPTAMLLHSVGRVGVAKPLGHVFAEQMRHAVDHGGANRHAVEFEWNDIHGVGCSVGRAGWCPNNSCW